MTKQTWKRLTICLTPEEHQCIREVAAKLGYSMAEFIRLYLRGHILDIKLKADKSVLP